MKTTTRTDVGAADFNADPHAAKYRGELEAHPDAFRKLFALLNTPANEQRLIDAEMHNLPALAGDQMAADWFVDHERHANGEAAESKMIAERNHDRHPLNQRAQALLRATGQLGEPIAIGDTEFHIGDRVVAQTANRDLHPAGANQRDHVTPG